MKNVILHIFRASLIEKSIIHSYESPKVSISLTSCDGFFCCELDCISAIPLFLD